MGDSCNLFSCSERRELFMAHPREETEKKMTGYDETIQVRANKDWHCLAKGNRTACWV